MTSSPAAMAQQVILIVDDELSLREAVSYSLQREGWQVVLANDGQSAISHARKHQPDLILLDVMLPGMDGLQVCRAIRAESSVPILFLSARGEEIDRIVGLEIGGDDYITKPFAMRELIARVRANLRRSQVEPAPDPETVAANGAVRARTPQEIVAGDLRIDLRARSVFIDDKVVSLTPREFELLSYLARHAGQAISRQVLLRDVWDHDYPVDTRTVDVHVRGLRSKLDPNSDKPKIIETVRRYGYRFSSPTV